jgi:SAM-dependent methyltransferase
VSTAERALRAPRPQEDLRDREAVRAFYDDAAAERDGWHARNGFYHAELLRLVRRHCPPGRRVLEIGCGTGDLLAALEPSAGVGLDFSEPMLERARAKHPRLAFVRGDAEELPDDLARRGPFDVVVLSDLVGSLVDVERACAELHAVCDEDTRVVVTYYNYLWEPVLRTAERLRLKAPQPPQNWLSLADLRNLLDLAGFETIKSGTSVLLPVRVPLLSRFLNRYVAPLPLVEHLCVLMQVVARKRPPRRERTVSVVIPCRNEADNVDALVDRTPVMGAGTEIVFVDGASTDGTVERIEAAIARRRGDRTIRLLHQRDPKGKAEATHIGFRGATGEVLMILDADVTVMPEDLVKFYEVIAEGRAEFVNGSRLVYPMDRHAMRFLNLLGNKFFSVLLTWLLGQRVRDTLCGTKVLLSKHYDRVMAVRDEIGDVDPFGDFELLLGASAADLRIVEIPVRYRERTYGTTKISRFRHGWQLLLTCAAAARKLKLL